MITNVGRLPAGLSAAHGAANWALSAAKKISSADLIEIIAAGKGVMSSTADPAKRKTVAKVLPSPQTDDDDVMQQMGAAFGGLYESAARINQVCNEVNSSGPGDSDVDLGSKVAVQDAV
jgi:hypothetical protein